MANLLFKTYFKLNSVAMSRSILTSIGALKTDKPPFESFPRSQRVTFKYYQGVLAFLEEHYSEVCLSQFKSLSAVTDALLTLKLARLSNA